MCSIFVFLQSCKNAFNFVGGFFMQTTWLYVVIAFCVLTMAYVIFNYVRIKKMEEGTERMVKMSAIIREGSNVFLKKEFTTIAIVVFIIALLLSLFIENFPVKQSFHLTRQNKVTDQIYFS